MALIHYVVTKCISAFGTDVELRVVVVFYINGNVNLLLI